MKALIAVDPLRPHGKCFDLFCDALHSFQQRGLLTQSTIASAIHSALYPVPKRWYREFVGRYAGEARERVETACQGRFSFESVKVLASDSSRNEDTVSEISIYAQKKGGQVLVVGSNNRTGFPHWILGSFAETAAMTATLPVLVIKPAWKTQAYSRETRLILAVDAAAPPSAKQLRWVAAAARSASARVDLVYVQSEPPLNPEKVSKILSSLQKDLRAASVVSEFHIIKETQSSAHALDEFAEKKKALVTIVCSASRSIPHKLLLGSTARRLLALTKRPFLSLR